MNTEKNETILLIEEQIARTDRLLKSIKHLKNFEKTKINYDREKQLQAIIEKTKKNYDRKSK